MIRAVGAAFVHARLREGREIALVDLREEGPYARAHPLFAVNLPLSRIELLALELIPNPRAPIVLYGEDAPGEGHALVARAATVLARLGYADIAALEGGLQGWRRAGGELFRDVNVPGKAFGELVCAQRRTPSVSAEALHRQLEAGGDLVVLDARRFEEYAAMSIPCGRSVPGGELALRARDIAPDPRTTIVVNCAGRTRSIIGAQSLVNAGVPNPVFALRNGTIGWTLAGLPLEHGASRRPPPAREAGLAAARHAARALARRAGVRWIDADGLRALEASGVTLYRLDVRTAEEYRASHPAGFRHAPGGQLVQATDEWVGVRHGTLVLTDDDGVRANMAAHWLRQLGWRAVFVLEGWEGLARETGEPPPRVAAPARAVETVEPAALAVLLEAERVLLIDVTRSASFREAHIPGARFAPRASLEALDLARAARGAIALTCGSGLLAAHAAADLARRDLEVRLLRGGTAAWRRAGLPVARGLSAEEALVAPDDVYKRPYEGTDNDAAAMQAYLEWEFGLVEQLARDGTHGFAVLAD